jgi:hypothetical protein
MKSHLKARRADRRKISNNITQASLFNKIQHLFYKELKIEVSEKFMSNNRHFCVNACIITRLIQKIM